MSDGVVSATFPKRERLVSRKLIDMLFGGGASHSAVAFPIRVIYKYRARVKDETPVQVLVSVSKRHFKHAVDRNLVKRQVREAYRHHKQIVFEAVPENEQLLIAFVWLADRHYTTAEVEERIVNLLKRLAEKRRASEKQHTEKQ